VTAPAVVRPARVEDAAAVANVHIASWRHAYVGLVPQSLLDGLSVTEGTERWSERIEGADPSRRRILVSVVDDAVRGFAAVGQSRDEDAPETTGELSAIYLHPLVIGRGVGHLLHERAIDQMRDLGKTDGRLWVLSTNVATRRFYERHGWIHDEVDQVILKDGVDLYATRYVRRL
jgi:GNAT superfamily N-acetyltransferase